MSRAGALARSILIAAAVVVGAGCTDLSQRWELDHARVLAVRLSAPGLAPDQQAVVDALVVGADGVAVVMAPTVARAVDGSAPVTVAPAATGWTVTAGDAAAIAAARAAAGRAADQPLEVVLGTVFTIDDQAYAAAKRVRLGEALPNPAAPTIRVDEVAASGVTTVARGRAIALTLDGVPADEPGLEVSWLTATGTLTGSQTARATLELDDDDPARGQVVVIIRSDVGGVTWATADLAAP